MTRAAAVVIGRNEGPRLPPLSALGPRPVRLRSSTSIPRPPTAASTPRAPSAPTWCRSTCRSPVHLRARPQCGRGARCWSWRPTSPTSSSSTPTARSSRRGPSTRSRRSSAAPAVAAVHGRVRERHARATVFDRLFELEFDPRTETEDVFGGMAMLRVAAYRGGRPIHGACCTTFEDHELSVRLRRAGWQMRRLDADMVIHEAGMTRWRDWWTREHRSGYGRAQLMPARQGVAHPRWRRAYASIWFWGALVPVACGGHRGCAGRRRCCLAGLAYLALLCSHRSPHAPARVRGPRCDALRRRARPREVSATARRARSLRDRERRPRRPPPGGRRAVRRGRTCA